MSINHQILLCFDVKKKKMKQTQSVLAHSVYSREQFLDAMCHCAFDWQVLQKLGKADETKDAAFEEGVINFNKQYVSTVPTFGCHLGQA